MTEQITVLATAFNNLRVGALLRGCASRSRRCARHKRAEHPGRGVTDHSRSESETKGHAVQPYP